jgi:hypothetical protein
MKQVIDIDQTRNRSRRILGIILLSKPASISATSGQALGQRIITKPAVNVYQLVVIPQSPLAPTVEALPYLVALPVQ